jgi:hydroxymethylpyrimidine/phosphomethylpyrimidine kinase
MVSKHGAPLLPPGAVDAIRRLLLPRAALITPNVPEAEALTGGKIATLGDMRAAACRLHDLGARAVLIKGGHLQGDAADLLFENNQWTVFGGERLDTPHNHGTGCTYSAAITAGLARGLALAKAVALAKRYIQESIRTNPGLGLGCGPVNHHAEVE